jgi:hypothetical protein
MTTVLGVTPQPASTLKIKAKLFRNAICESARRHIPGEISLYTHRRECVKYHKIFLSTAQPKVDLMVQFWQPAHLMFNVQPCFFAQSFAFATVI